MKMDQVFFGIHKNCGHRQSLRGTTWTVVAGEGSLAIYGINIVKVFIRHLLSVALRSAAEAAYVLNIAFHPSFATDTLVFQF